MAKVNFKDFKGKEFLVQKGERVGLGVALFLMIVLIITSLFIPPNGFFSGSPADKADSLTKDTNTVKQKLTNNRPSDADKPGDAKDKLIALETQAVHLDPYRVISFFEAQQAGSSSRRPPELLTMDGAAAMALALNVKTYQLIPNEDGEYSRIIVLDTGGAGGKGGFPMMGGMRGAMPRMPGGPGGMPGGAGGRTGSGQMGPGGGRGPATMQPGMYRQGANVQAAEDSERKEYKEKIVSIDEVDKLQGFEPAVQPRPLRMAIIEGSFPYKRQLEEFKNKLRLASITDVLNETVKTKDGDVDAFRFTGVNVQRRELDPAGNPLSDWQTIDPARAYIPWMMLSGQEREDENPELLRIKFPGLVMDRLRAFRSDDLAPRANQAFTPGMPFQPARGPGGLPGTGDLVREHKDSPYPKVYESVPNLKKTLQELNREGNASRQIAAPRSRFSPKSVDPWRPPQQNTEDRNPTPSKEEGPKEDATVPEHCLVRVIDITIEPGKTYQYRLQVRMANPNYKRTDVASQSYAQNEELEVDNKKWFEVPQKVTVQPEMIHYVVDQAEVEKGYRGVNWREVVHADREVALQIHRWIEATYLGKQKYLTFIGDWAIADRVIVARGEQIGRRVKVEMPVWKYNAKDYIIAADPHDKSKKPGIEINFGYERSDGAEALLVDFEGGKGQIYSPTPTTKTEDGTPAPPTRRVLDDSGIEVLILTPDGKLISRNSASDRDDKDRNKQRDELHKHIDDAKKKGGGKSTDKPFG